MAPFWNENCTDQHKDRNMKRIARIGLIGLLSFIFHGCTKTTEGRWVVYYETGCNEPWMSEKSDNKTRNNLEDALKTDGIIPLKIKFKGEREQQCTTCDCETGKEIWVQVDKSQVGYMYWYGFESK